MIDFKCFKLYQLLYTATCCPAGIGRVTGRLPRELADEVVGSLLELFRNDPVALRLTVVWDILTKVGLARC